jgi:hypothetical protein
MSMGLASVGGFCFAAYLFLARMAPADAFALALLISSAMHALTWLLFKKPRSIRI